MWPVERMVAPLWAILAKKHYNKSKLVFSRNTTNNLISNLANLIGASELDDLGIYLSLPTSMGRNRKAVFYYIKERIWRCLNSWKRRFLSIVSKEVLLKLVVQVLPAYTMSLFILPKDFYSDIEKIMNSFLWGSTKDTRASIYWKRWDLLCTSREKGGVQIFKEFMNSTLLY